MPLMTASPQCDYPIRRVDDARGGTNFLEWVEPLPQGHQGTIRTLQVMRWLARKDYSSAEVGISIRNLLKQQPNLPPVAALFLFARDQIKYVTDPPNMEKVSDFQHTTESREGDCDDKITWLATALLSIGVPVRFVVQSANGGDWDHVYLEFYDWSNFAWVALDPTADGHSNTPIANIGWRNPLPVNGKEMTFEV